MCDNELFTKKESKKKNFILMNGLTRFTDRERQLFKTDKVGLYSITSSDIAEDIAINISKYFKMKPNIAITDATASVGGNSLSFLIHPTFNPINLVEVSPIRANCLRNNILLIEKKIQKKTYTIYTQSFMDIMMELDEDVIFIDPPWGGPDYYKYEEIDLFLSGDEPLVDICNKLFTKPRLELIVLKVPKNFGIKNFKNHLESSLELSKFRSLEILRKMEILFLKKKEV